MRKKIKRNSQFFTYMLECENGAYYTGYTNNLENRIKLHNSGRGAKYTKMNGPVKLVYAKEFKYYKLALNFEREIKQLTRKQKEMLALDYTLNNKG